MKLRKASALFMAAAMSAFAYPLLQPDYPSC